MLSASVSFFFSKGGTNSPHLSPLPHEGSGNLRSSETIEAAVDSLGGIENLDALLINCSDHKSTCSALPKLKAKLRERVENGGSPVRIGACGFFRCAVSRHQQFNCQFSQSLRFSRFNSNSRRVRPHPASRSSYSLTPADANGFVSVQDPEQDGVQFLDLSPDVYLAQAREYVELGADIVGGCCGVYPEHIEAVSKGLAH